ncbi:MAG: aminoacyl-tRNA hydrolase [Holophagaceae bacterium]|nr:aminoacyl-tRNA hydrolase [Holophagaceae bacterium]
MAEPIQINDQVVVPERAQRLKAVRSGGPGGQNVNKVSSKAELRIDLTQIEGLDELALMRLRHLIRNQLDAEGLWIINSDRFRDLPKNIEDNRAKAIAVIAQALVIPKTRHKTRPSKGSKERRIESKKRVGAVKAGRQGSWD